MRTLFCNYKHTHVERTQKRFRYSVHDDDNWHSSVAVDVRQRRRVAPPHPLFKPPFERALVIPALPFAMQPAHSPNTSHPQSSGRVAFRSDAEPPPKMHQESTLLKALLKSAAAGASSLQISRVCQHRLDDRPKRDARTGIINWDTVSNKLKQVGA